MSEAETSEAKTKINREPSSPPPFSGSTLRDRMANERTLLAWVRTSITLMAFGMAVSKFSLVLTIAGFEHKALAVALPHPWASRAVGATFLLFGALIAFLGLRRTLAYASIIDPHERDPNNHLLVLVSVGVIFLSAALTLEVLFSALPV